MPLPMTPQPEPAPPVRRFRVLNPLELPAGITILSYAGVDYREGDEFDLPDGLDPERLLRDGYVEELTDG